jgi:tetrahydromethanopterin S-methyltransferase subunit C
MVMNLVRTIPLLVSILVGLLLGVLTWGVLRIRRPASGQPLIDTSDDVLLVLLALAAFSLGAFVTFVLLLGSNWGG